METHPKEPNWTLADIHFVELLNTLSILFDKEEAQGRSVTAEFRHRDLVWVWRGQPGFVGFPEHGDRNLVYRFDRETRRPVLWRVMVDS
jgi:hypothetical protein